MGFEFPAISQSRIEFWGKPQYTMSGMWWFTLFFGMIGLHHLLLRSPQTWLGFLLANTVTFGYWWLYDLIQLSSYGGHTTQSLNEFGLESPWYALGIAQGMWKDSTASFFTSFFKRFTSRSQKYPNAPQGSQEKEEPEKEKNQKGGNSLKEELIHGNDPPSPYFFMLYGALLYITPLAKLIAGDVTNAFLTLLFFTMIPFGPLGYLFAGFALLYDYYIMFLKPDELFQKGTSRAFPYTWMGIDPDGHSPNITTYSYSGPAKDAPKCAPPPRTLIQKIIDMIVWPFSMLFGLIVGFFRMIWNFFVSVWHRIFGISTSIVNAGKEVATASASASSSAAATLSPNAKANTKPTATAVTTVTAVTAKPNTNTNANTTPNAVSQGPVNGVVPSIPRPSNQPSNTPSNQPSNTPLKKNTNNQKTNVAQAPTLIENASAPQNTTPPPQNTSTEQAPQTPVVQASAPSSIETPPRSSPTSSEPGSPTSQVSYVPPLSNNGKEPHGGFQGSLDIPQLGGGQRTTVLDYTTFGGLIAFISLAFAITSSRIGTNEFERIRRFQVPNDSPPISQRL